MRPVISLFAVLAIASIVVTLAAPVPKMHRLESRSTATMTAHDQTAAAADVPDASLKVVQGGEDQLYARTVLPEIVEDLKETTRVSEDPAPGMTGATSSSSLSSPDQVSGKPDALKRWSRLLREAPLSPSDADARTLPVPNSRRRNDIAARRRKRFKPPRSLAHLKINLGASRSWLRRSQWVKLELERFNANAANKDASTAWLPGDGDKILQQNYYERWERRLHRDGEILNHASRTHDIPPFDPAIKHRYSRLSEVKAEIVDPGTSQHSSEPLQRQADVHIHDHGAEEPEVEHPVGPLKQPSRPSVRLRGALQAYQDPRLIGRLPPARPPSTPLKEVVEEDAIPNRMSPIASTDNMRRLELGESSTKKMMRPRVDPMRDNSGSYGRIHAVPETQASTIAGPFVHKYAPRER